MIDTYLRGLSVLSARNTRNTPRMELSVSVVRETMTSTQDTITRNPSITFHALRMYVSRPIQKPRAITWRGESGDIGLYFITLNFAVERAVRV